MELKTIIEQDALYMREVRVDINRAFSTVCIVDLSSVEHEDVFMQGHEADDFVDAIDKIAESHPEVNFEDIALHLAKPYVDCIWN